MGNSLQAEQQILHSRVCEIERKQISSKQTTNWLGRLTEWRKIVHMLVNRFYPKRASLTTKLYAHIHKKPSR